MTAYIIRRFLWMIPVLILVTIVTFGAMKLVPGGPFSSEGRPMSPEIRANFEARYHLDEPVWKQYIRYMVGDFVDTGKLRTLIAQLVQAHGDKYDQAPRHQQRLASLEQALRLAVQAGDDGRQEATETALAQLQREVLLFDVNNLMVIKRHEITASHVYTYHYEGFRAGGGLYVVSPLVPECPPNSRDGRAK